MRPYFLLRLLKIWWLSASSGQLFCAVQAALYMIVHVHVPYVHVQDTGMCTCTCILSSLLCVHVYTCIQMYTCTIIMHVIESLERWDTGSHVSHKASFHSSQSCRAVNNNMYLYMYKLHAIIAHAQVSTSLASSPGSPLVRSFDL